MRLKRKGERMYGVRDKKGEVGCIELKRKGEMTSIKLERKGERMYKMRSEG